MRYIVTLNNIRVEDGYEMPCRGMRSALEAIKANQPNNVTDNRSIYSLCCEWTVHNVLYRLGLFRERTKDVDMEYPCKLEWAYLILGSLIYPFAR